MRSFQHKPSNRRAMYLNLAGSVESQLRDAYARRHAAGLDTQTTLADKLGVGRSVVNKRLRGLVNMTLETVADMVWSLGYSVIIKIFDPNQVLVNEFHIVSEHTAGPIVIADPDIKPVQVFTSAPDFKHLLPQVQNYNVLEKKPVYATVP